VTFAHAKEPVIFFHGVGLGLSLYLPLLKRLDQRSQIFFEMPWIAMNPFSSVPQPEDYARWVVEALQAHGINSCVAMGHSFGSLPIAWLLRRHPNQISRCVLIEPVAMLLNLPDVCMNFLYKQPTSDAGWVTRFLVARELGIANTTMRHLFWTESVLFPEMLPSGSSVILADEDTIVPTADIVAAAAKVSHIRTVVFPGLDHGLFLTVPSAIKEVLKHVVQSAHPDSTLPSLLCGNRLFPDSVCRNNREQLLCLNAKSEVFDHRECRARGANQSPPSLPSKHLSAPS